MKYKYKCDDFTARSSTTMAGYILSQCSPEDIITAWYNLLECAPALYDGECDFIIGKFGLGALILLYRNNILTDEMYSWAYDRVDDWLTDEMELYAKSCMPMLDISVNINNFHIRITQED